MELQKLQEEYREANERLAAVIEENEALKSRIQELERQVKQQSKMLRRNKRDKIFLSASVIAQGFIVRHGIPDAANNSVCIAKEIYGYVYGRKAK